MLSEEVIKALNYQINRELYSAYFYAGMGSYAASAGFKGAVNWFSLQVKEELGHARRLHDYLIERGARVKLAAIEEPPQDFSSLEDLFKKTLEHEKRVTQMILDLVDLVKREKDEASESFLQWYVKEQVEEEESAGKVLGMLNSGAGGGDVLKRTDRELAKRR